MTPQHIAEHIHETRQLELSGRDLIQNHMEILQGDLRSAHFCVRCSYIVNALRDFSRYVVPVSWTLRRRRAEHFARVVHLATDAWLQAATDPTRAHTPERYAPLEYGEWLDQLRDSILDGQDW